jgi:hypothetical protein
VQSYNKICPMHSQHSHTTVGLESPPNSEIGPVIKDPVPAIHVALLTVTPWPSRHLNNRRPSRHYPRFNLQLIRSGTGVCVKHLGNLHLRAGEQIILQSGSWLGGSGCHIRRSAFIFEERRRFLFHFLARSLSSHQCPPHDHGC